MARIFTITEGIENMGALKTGGQGSVYKGKRIGEIISAIKILPTPIYSESSDDKNFVSFQNEVEKLKKVNEDANPNVVGILSSGITDSGNFPFIEMEYIEGPGLEELLKPPHLSVFTIREVLKVSAHLSNALAHCHRVDVKHGDVKSNNVKFNTHTGNYILLDFGLSVMSDEQRRTSLRQAGAIEFMAPEQQQGELLFETEVYSFGVILFELLSGTVPFPLKDNGDSSRNNVMVAQLEKQPPNLLALRQQNMPEWWSKEKKQHEMQVPEWLISMVYKCLEKKPSDRFANGMVLQEHIIRNSISAAGSTEWGANRIAMLEQENEKLQQERTGLIHKLADYESLVNSTDRSPVELTANYGKKKKVPFTINSVLTIFLLLIITGLFVSQVLIKKNTLLQTGSNNTLSNENVNKLQAGENLQLKKAGNFLRSGRLEEASLLYKSLALQQVPEAMYEYGNLSLLNGNYNVDCLEALRYIRLAAEKGYIPAKTTAGFLYCFGRDSLALKQNGYHQCSFKYDILSGSKFLMEAALQGDSAASLLLDDLNAKYGKRN